MSNVLPSRDELLQQIAEASIYGNLGLFVGAGMSIDASNTAALSWPDLLKNAYERLNNCYKDKILGRTDDILLEAESVLNGQSLPAIASIICESYANKGGISFQDAQYVFKEIIAELTACYASVDKQQEYGSLLDLIAPSWIITTNYDSIIESLLPSRLVSVDPSFPLCAPKGTIPVYHLHGLRTNPESIVITKEDYKRILHPHEYRTAKLPLLIKESTILTLGYSLGDINVQSAIDGSKAMYGCLLTHHPHQIIQTVKRKSPSDPYYSDCGRTVVLEINGIVAFLQEVLQAIDKRKQTIQDNYDSTQRLRALFNNPSQNDIDTFVVEKSHRKNILDCYFVCDKELVVAFLHFLSLVFDKTIRLHSDTQVSTGSGNALVIILDILSLYHDAPDKIHPLLLSFLTDQLRRISFPLVPPRTDAVAREIWESRIRTIHVALRKEICSIASKKHYFFLEQLLQKAIDGLGNW